LNVHVQDKEMKIRTLLIILISLGVSLITLTVVITFGIFRFVRYIQVESLPHELAPQKIKREFKRLTRYELPAKTNNLRAILERGRDAYIFVRFQTDPEGVEYVKRSFGGQGVRSQYLDKDILKYKTIFTGVSIMEEYAGIKLFDQESIGPGLEISREAWSGLSYKIFIEDKTNTVYIYAFLR
jgi:hypothetical protein